MSLPPPIPLAEAQARLLNAVKPLGTETLAVEDCTGRYLADTLLARRTQPAADLSAMDGYAVRADDVAGPWEVVGESAAGHPFAGLLSVGQAVRISTGALMPDSETAVLLQENATRDGDHLALNSEGEPTPRHIRRMGFDFGEGDVLLTAGTRIDPAQIALALSGGHGTLVVGKLPRIAILDSGDELAPDPEQVLPHQVPASNGAMLAAMVAPLASEVRRLGPVPDRLDAMVAALESANDCDVIVTSGGASVGDHDLVRPALARWGAEIDFWRVAIKPGKPLMVARKGERWVIGLPGNPVSGYVTAYLFLLPLLRKLASASENLPRAFSLPLGTSLAATGSRLEFVRARLDGASVTPVYEQDSSALVALSRADALIRREVNSEAAHEGDPVLVYLLQNGGIA